MRNELRVLAIILCIAVLFIAFPSTLPLFASSMGGFSINPLAWTMKIPLTTDALLLVALLLAMAFGIPFLKDHMKRGAISWAFPLIPMLIVAAMLTARIVIHAINMWWYNGI